MIQELAEVGFALRQLSIKAVDVREITNPKSQLVE
jgi:hypothetical protein